MTRIMISGADGTGKSTIINALESHLKLQQKPVEKVWLRFNHLFAKLVNIVGRLTGKSYYEEYAWGKLGYHSYHGVFGYLYIVSVYLDHVIFFLFKRRKVFGKKNKFILIDRYIVDIVADLIVDTGHNNFVHLLFDRFVYKELKITKAYIVDCDLDTIITRRSDILDDKNIRLKLSTYNDLAKYYRIEIINTKFLGVKDAVKYVFG